MASATGNDELGYQNADTDIPLMDTMNEEIQPRVAPINSDHLSEGADEPLSKPNHTLHQSFEYPEDLFTHENTYISIEPPEESYNNHGAVLDYPEDDYIIYSQQTAAHGEYDENTGGYIANTNGETDNFSSNHHPGHDYPNQLSENLLNLTDTSQINDDTDIGNDTTHAGYDAIDEDLLFVDDTRYSSPSIEEGENRDKEFPASANLEDHDREECDHHDNPMPPSITNSPSLEELLTENEEDENKGDYFCENDRDYADGDSESDDDELSPSLGLEQQNANKSIYDHPLEQSKRISSEKKKTQRKKTGPRAKTAKEWFLKRNEALNELTTRAQDSKRKQPSDGLQDPAATASKKPKPKGTNVIRIKGRGKSSNETTKALMDNLRNNNPMEARIELGELPEMDPITAKTKSDQFLQLMNTLPQNADKRSVKADKKNLMEASRSFGYGNCIARDGKWLVKGLKTPLHAHQVIASSWMLNREFSGDAPSGGILADEMGMGKTLETLGCIVSNRPAEDKIYHKATLIIAPATAVKQWADEIKKHTERSHIKGVLMFKQSQQLPEEAWENMDIIIASYHEVSRQYPSKASQTKVRRANYSEEKEKEKLDDLLGPLFKTSFWRVVLDEAHQIKNDKSQMSLACRNLKGRYRWAISGTPITNNVDELYPYLKFLVPGWNCKLDKFQYHFGNIEDNSTAARLGAILSAIMIRRTSKDRFMGQPLYTIPLCRPEFRQIQLTKEERVIYEVVEARYRRIINRKLREENARNSEYYFQWLLRLRQGAAHPLLLEPALKQTLSEADIREIKTRLAKVGGEKSAFKQVRDWCGNVTTEIEVGYENGLPDSQIAIGASKFGYEFNMDKQIDMALASKNESLCRICCQEPETPHQAECSHIFCKECAENHILDERRAGKMPPRCPECDNPLAGLKPLETESEGSEPSYFGFGEFASESSALEAYDDIASFRQQFYDTNSSASPTLGKDGKRLGRDFFNVHPKLKKSKSTFLLECDKAYPEPVVPSSKTIAAKKAVLQWQTEAPDDKIIIFTQFKMVGAIIGRMLQEEMIPFLYFFGDMSQKEKNNAITGFEERKKVKVMIASLKCGGVALNLTCANRVILVDPWWNAAIEIQAFARVFRMGQKKETHFLRLVCQNTVDNRMEALQNEKLKNISEVLERGGSSGPKLATEELISLFGKVKENGDGGFEVVNDYTN